MDSVLFERTFRTCAREPRARYMPRWWEAAWNDASGSTAYTVALFMITRTKHSKTILTSFTPFCSFSFCVQHLRYGSVQGLGRQKDTHQSVGEHADSYAVPFLEQAVRLKKDTANA